jgi:hypothetical protein
VDAGDRWLLLQVFSHLGREGTDADTGRPASAMRPICYVLAREFCRYSSKMLRHVTALPTRLC